MNGIEQSYFDAVLRALVNAYYGLMESKAEDVLAPADSYVSKVDTMRLDAIPEILVASELLHFDPDAIVITEERGSESTTSAFGLPHSTMFIGDPMDGTMRLLETLRELAKSGKTVGQILREPAARTLWETKEGSQAEVTGCTSSFTCIRNDVPVFTVLVNHISHELIGVCAAGIYRISLSPQRRTYTSRELIVDGVPLFFPSIDPNNTERAKRFVTFVGAEGKTIGYKENLAGCKLLAPEEIERYQYKTIPVGPSRPLYLSALQPVENQIGFVLANGEKIGEWIHWLTFARFARHAGDQSAPALRLFEIHHDRPCTKDGVLMSTPPAYSLFEPSSRGTSGVRINVARLFNFENPSKFRSSLILMPAENQWLSCAVRQFGYRPIALDF